MVLPTSIPDVLKVSFVMDAANLEPVVNMVEVVCYVVPDRRTGKLTIYYSEHMWFYRESIHAPWTNRSQARVALTPALRAQIHTGVFHELANYTGVEVKELPFPISSMREETQRSDNLLRGLL